VVHFTFAATDQELETGQLEGKKFLWTTVLTAASSGSRQEMIAKDESEKIPTMIVIIRDQN
jgi:hypothetical protein